MSPERDARGPDASEPGTNLPEPRRQDEAAVRQPIDQIARAMQLQAEVLKQMHDRQRAIEDAIKDDRRHELVINSAQALNDSFRGLQAVQERLASKLDEGAGGRLSKLHIALIAALGLVILGTGVFLALRIGDGADELGRDLKSALDPSARDAQLKSAMETLEKRVQGVETSDREVFRAEVERLRSGLDQLRAERDSLRIERDKAREELGVARAAVTSGEANSAEWKARLDLLEKENARLTAQSVGDQRLIGQLNSLVGQLKDRAPDPPGPRAETRPLVADAGTPAPPPKPAEVIETSAAFQQPQLDALNTLVSSHRGSDRYRITRAERVTGSKLSGVTMEVRGADGSLAKTIEATTLACWLSQRGDILELEFEGGTVTFEQAAGTRAVKSPFFNDRYQIVVLGVNGGAWLKSGFPFVKTRSGFP